MSQNKKLHQTGSEIKWHSLSSKEVLEILETDLLKGLEAKTAEERLEHFGPNILEPAEKATWHSVFFRQFVNILIFILLVAAVISFSIGEWKDATTIMLIVVFNAVLGFIQEWKAEKSIQALEKMLEPECEVVRDGVRTTIDSGNLVPGDIVYVETGNSVPADLRIVESTNLKADESSLTGESVSVDKSAEPVSKDQTFDLQSSVCWMGTLITNGRAKGVVVNTGASTAFGRIAELTQTIEREETPLQKKLGVLAGQLGLLAVVIAAAVILSGWYLGKTLIEMFFTGVALAVAVVPEGLPAVVTITLALGIRSMVKHKALIRRLHASETLGSANIICTDKTGTLTQNQMTVQMIWFFSDRVEVTGEGYSPSGHFVRNGEDVDPGNLPELISLLETGYKCNHSLLMKTGKEWKAIGEPTEAALVVAGMKAGLLVEEEMKIISEFSFSSSRKMMTVVERKEQQLIAHVKGAPEVIIDKSLYKRVNGKLTELEPPDRDRIRKIQLEMGEKGLRTLALARRELPEDILINEENVECKLTFLGLVGIMDPPRAEVKNAIALSRSAGIKTVMITGDAPATALSIAKNIGMNPGNAITGYELSRMDDTSLRNSLKKDVIFARTAPEDKLRIVNLLQESGNIVAMTGDGVNDAPALTSADIGIAMGIRGTEVARSASDMILTDDNYASIIRAIEEGRRQYDSIKKFVRYLLSSNLAEVIAIIANILIGGPLILLPVQILWMNLVTDGMTAVALGLEPGEKGIMERPPKSPDEQIIDREGIITMLLIGLYMGAATLFLFHHYLSSDTTDAVLKAQTVAFTGLIVLEKMNVFNFRALKAPLFVVGFFTNRWLLLAWAVSLGLQVCAVYVPFLQNTLYTVPIGISDWILIFSLAVPLFLIFEALKIIRWKRRRKEEDVSSEIR